MKHDTLLLLSHFQFYTDLWLADAYQIHVTDVKLMTHILYLALRWSARVRIIWIVYLLGLQSSGFRTTTTG